MTRVILLMIITMVLAGPAHSGIQAVSVGKPTAPAVRGEYVIGPEDILDISVWNNTAISRTVPVRPDGMISPCGRTG
jgi:polysaccharide biosynthesis/export protein